MIVVFAQIVQGIAAGSMYALMVTGLNLMLLVAGVFQYAYPHVVVLSMYISWAVMAASGNIPLGVAAGVGAGLGLSLLTEPLFRRLAERGAVVPTFILALGIALIFSNIMARQIHAGLPITFPIALEGKEALFRVGLATITRGQLSTIAGSISGVAGLLYLVYRTKLGRSFRAMAQAPVVARLLGIPMRKTTIISYGVAGLLGGISAVLLAMALGGATCVLGDQLALKVIAVALFAGLGNLRGGVIAGFILGLAETFVIGYLPGDWANAIAFGMIMVVVMWRPEGLFGVRA